MANEENKDFNAMLRNSKDMPKIQTVTDQKTIDRYGGSRMFFAPPAEYERIMKIQDSQGGTACSDSGQFSAAADLRFEKR